MIDAAIERAISIVDGAAKANEDIANANIRRLQAGSAQIEYFRPITDPSQFPKPVLDRIGIWLCGSSAVAGSSAYGTDGTSNFGDDFEFNRGF